MASHGFSSVADAAQKYRSFLVSSLSESRRIDGSLFDDVVATSIPDLLVGFDSRLRDALKIDEADAIEHLHDKVTRSPPFGGIGLSEDTIPSQSQYDETCFQTEAWLESLKSKESSRDYLSVNTRPVQGARPMTLAQKIFTQHALSGVGPDGCLALGDVVRVGVDWILASELSWSAMDQVHQDIGSPGIWRNDRLWIAGDHLVHPTIREEPKIKAFVETAEKAKKNLRMTEYQGMNYTIMHTEFVRERAQPGMLCIGSDSHSCSAGAVGCLSIGLGTADVMMTLALGETWFKIPESVLIEFVGQPAFGISGKDVILHILKELKRNTVAAERIVEFTGTGAKYLSVDARFAICNMCTEFGAITGAFVPDDVTSEYVNSRKRKMDRSSSVYFRPDEGARYASRHKIDLSAVEPTVAKYPEPDNVLPVSEMARTSLDGVFIGACTTTEEELVLGALILKAGLAKNLPLARGKRHYVPGSLPIVQKLQELGLLKIYEEAGFTRGPPGCSMCVGLTAEKASEGETWLSSQNRNFANRMGKGSFGHLSSAIVCAASSFSMTITSPEELLKDLDVGFFRSYKGTGKISALPVQYVEPDAVANGGSGATEQTDLQRSVSAPLESIESIKSKVVTLPDFIDTDALAPGETLVSCKTEAEFGKHVLKYTHPNFRSQVAAGQEVVVGGHAFGVGSSREVAVSALKGAGVRCVIARSFAFIYSRNQPSLGLLGIVMEDDAFYAAAKDGEDISVDVASRTIAVGGKEFGFKLSNMEYQLTMNDGIAKAYGRFGRAIWENLMKGEGAGKEMGKPAQLDATTGDQRLNW